MVVWGYAPWWNWGSERSRALRETRLVWRSGFRLRGRWGARTKIKTREVLHREEINSYWLRRISSIRISWWWMMRWGAWKGAEVRTRLIQNSRQICTCTSDYPQWGKPMRPFTDEGFTQKNLCFLAIPLRWRTILLPTIEYADMKEMNIAFFRKRWDNIEDGLILRLSMEDTIPSRREVKPLQLETSIKSYVTWKNSIWNTLQIWIVLHRS